MKVTLLGTAAAEGWPALFCGCDACKVARHLGGRNIRTRSSALIDDVLKIDFPPDILSQVIQNGLDLRKLRAILFTHSHDDHCAPSELQYRGHYFVPKPVEDRLPIYGSVDVVDSILRVLSPDGTALDPDRFPLEFGILSPWVSAEIAGYTVIPVVANHDPNEDCFNYLVRDSEGATLLYATDTGWYSGDTWDRLRQYTLNGVVIEATKGMQEDGYEGHLSIPQVIAFRRRLLDDGVVQKDTPFVTTHMSHLSGLLHDQMQAILDPHNIRVGYDGMVFQVTADTNRPDPTLQYAPPQLATLAETD